MVGRLVMGSLDGEGEDGGRRGTPRRHGRGGKPAPQSTHCRWQGHNQPRSRAQDGAANVAAVPETEAPALVSDYPSGNCHAAAAAQGRQALGCLPQGKRGAGCLQGPASFQPRKRGVGLDASRAFSVRPAQTTGKETTTANSGFTAKIFCCFLPMLFTMLIFL